MNYRSPLLWGVVRVLAVIALAMTLKVSFDEPGKAWWGYAMVYVLFPDGIKKADSFKQVITNFILMSPACLAFCIFFLSQAGLAILVFVIAFVTMTWFLPTQERFIPFIEKTLKDAGLDERE